MNKVSVIVPNYNHASFLEQRIESILEQTFRDYELILLDDFSNDTSRDIIDKYKKRYPHIKVFFNDRNSGNPFGQWDCGVRLAGGEYVWIAESDDYADKNFLAEMVPILEENRNVGFVYCDATIVDDQSWPIASVSADAGAFDGRRSDNYINDGKDEIKKYLCTRNTINNTSGVLFRKVSYINAGFADHTMRYCGDWFLYLRILLMTNVAYRAKPLNYLRFHAGSSFREYYVSSAYIEEVMRIYNFVMQNVSISSEIKKKIYEQLCSHFCMFLKTGFFPSKRVRRAAKEIIPLFELNLVRFLAKHTTKKIYDTLRGHFHNKYNI